MNQYKIGLDCDDTIMDTHSSIIRIGREKYGIDLSSPSRYSFEEFVPFSIAKNIITEAITDYKNLFPIKGAIDFLLQYNKPVTFITYRGGWCSQDTTYKWFKYWLPKEIQYKILFPNEDELKSKYIQQENIDIYFEDRYKYCLDISNYCKVFMISKPWNLGRELNSNIIRLDSWNELIIKE